MRELSPFLLTIAGNIVIAIGIILVVLLTKTILNKATKYLEYITALTVGLLLGIIFLGFIPKLTTKGNLVGEELGIFILIGIFFFSKKENIGCIVNPEIKIIEKKFGFTVKNHSLILNGVCKKCI
ncbi:hypothetical protein LR004_01735 [Candidatus Gracilibacteria bacterium]|nr:hypothetical protein [Candidatus Gracilibacteria bacterium]